MIAILVVPQCTTEPIISSNYALAQILATPMALLITHLAAPGVSMVAERIADTALGAAIGVVVAVIGSSPGERRRLGRRGAASRDRLTTRRKGGG